LIRARHRLPRSLAYQLAKSAERHQRRCCEKSPHCRRLRLTTSSQQVAMWYDEANKVNTTQREGPDAAEDVSDEPRLRRRSAPVCEAATDLSVLSTTHLDSDNRMEEGVYYMACFMRFAQDLVRNAPRARLQLRTTVRLHNCLPPPAPLRPRQTPSNSGKIRRACQIHHCVTYLSGRSDSGKRRAWASETRASGRGSRRVGSGPRMNARRREGEGPRPSQRAERD